MLIKLIVFTDGDVTFEYNEENLAKLTEYERVIESIFGTMSDEKAIASVKKIYPQLTTEDIIQILQTRVFPKAYKEIIPGFLKAVALKYPQIKIAIATEHTKFVDFYLKDFTSEYYISNEIGCDKSEKAFFQTIINRSGVIPRDILYVDFDENNVNMAKSCGISAIKVNAKDLNLLTSIARTETGHRLIDTLKQVENKIKKN